MFAWCEKHLYIQNCAEIRLITADLQIYIHNTQGVNISVYFFYLFDYVMGEMSGHEQNGNSLKSLGHCAGIMSYCRRY